MFFAADLLDLAETEHAALFAGEEPVWTALPRLAGYLAERLDSLEGKLIEGRVHPRAVVGERVRVAAGAVIEANAVVAGPAWIGSGTVVRSGAYLRENVLAGDGCVLGNSSEFKNCLLFNRCEVPHFNYAGDSILGHRAHLGAGAVCSNVRLDRRPVRVRSAAGPVDTGLVKFGAVVGDGCEIGCHTVLSPGTILGRGCLLHPGLHWSGVLEAGRVVLNAAEQRIVERERR